MEEPGHVEQLADIYTNDSVDKVNYLQKPAVTVSENLDKQVEAAAFCHADYS